MNLFKSAHLSSTKAAALKKAKNATMCPALNVQWNSQSITAMLSVNSAMMRCHKSAPLSILRSARLKQGNYSLRRPPKLIIPQAVIRH